MSNRVGLGREKGMLNSTVSGILLALLLASMLTLAFATCARFTSCPWGRGSSYNTSSDRVDIVIDDPPYNATIWAWDNVYGWLYEPITLDGVPTNLTTPYTFTGLTTSHTFTVPSTDGFGNSFGRWSTGQTNTTITVTSDGIYTAQYYAPYNATIWAWDNVYGWLYEPITLDGVPTNLTTPYTFTGLTTSHTFTVPSTDGFGNSFGRWSTGQTNTATTVYSSGTYTAQYYAPYLNITVGTNTTVTPILGLTLTFANVTTAGILVANETPTVFAPPLTNLVGQYYDIKVTASFSSVNVSLAFDGSNMTQQQKSNLQMMQYTPIPGDIQPAFGQVDMRDIGYIARRFGTNSTSPLWDPAADITGPTPGVPDGKIDMRDIGLCARNWAKTSQWINITTYVDTANNIIYGDTTHFSLIGIHN